MATTVRLLTESDVASTVVGRVAVSSDVPPRPDDMLPGTDAQVYGSVPSAWFSQGLIPVSRGCRIETVGIVSYKRQVLTTITGAFEQWQRGYAGSWSAWTKVL